MTGVTPCAPSLRYTVLAMNARFQVPPGARLRLTTSSGDISVIAEERTDIEAPENARAVTTSDEHGPVLEVTSPRGGSRDLELRCPSGTPISVGTISGDVRLRGEFGSATVTTTSGDVSVDRAAALDARSVSGDLEVVCCSGHCRLSTKSGHIEAGDTGPTEATTVSGRVLLRSTAGVVTVRTVSGNVELGTDGTEAVNARTISGRITVRVPKERLPAARLRSLSGRIDCDCPQGSDFPLEVTSVSGKIEVEPA